MFIFCMNFSGENISHHLAAVIKSWNLRDYVFVTDNAANEQKAIRLLGAPRIGCYGHRLNLVVKHALANTDACHLVEKGRHLVTFFHCSTSATELLLEKQKLLLPEAEQNHRLIQDVQTRWNSTLDMLSRLYEQHQTLCAVAADTGVLGKRAKELGSKLYTFKEQNDVKDLIDLLQPFKIATQTLSSDKYPTQGLILPVLKKLSLALEIRPDDSVMIKAMKADMTMQLESRTTDKDYALVASLLTPSTKQMLFISDEDRLIAHNLLFEQLLESHTKFLVKNEQTIDQNANTLVDLPELPSLPGPSADVTSEQICVSDELKPEVCSVPSKKIKTTIEDKKETHGTSWLQDVIFVSQSERLSPKELASNELKSYLAEPVPTLACSDLSWWKQNDLKYPKLAILARKHLSTPASSVSAERIFSLTGNIISKKRARLKPELVEKLVFLNKNKYLLKD